MRWLVGPVNGFDLASAVVGAALSNQGHVQALKAEQANELDNQDLHTIADLSDGLWLRYGRVDLSPAYLAYLGEVCPTYEEWGELPDAADLDPVGRVLHASLSPCQGGVVPAHEARRPPLHVSADCVVASQTDATSPAEWAEAWGGKQVESSSSAHWLDGVRQCGEEMT